MVVYRPKQGLLVALLALIWTAAQSSERSQVIDQVVKLSALDAQVMQVATFASSELELRKDVMPAEEYKRLRDVVAEAFAAERLKRDVRQGLERRYQAQRFQEWLAWLQQPLVRRMHELEEASTAEDFDQMMAMVDQLEDVAKERRDLVRRLDTATSTTTLALDTQSAVLRAMLRASAPYLPPNRRPQGQELEQVVEATQAQLEPALRRVTRLSFLYAYRDVDTSVLREYVNQYESETGQWAVHTLRDCVRDALTAATARAKRLAETALSQDR